MGELIFILVSLVLLGGFLALTSWETSRGVRLFAQERSAFDRRIEHALFIIDNVDWGAFVREHVNAAFVYIGHEIVHLSLQAIRSLERLLTRAVRTLRTRIARDTTPGETARPFVQALSGFKEELRASRPTPPEA